MKNIILLMVMRKGLVVALLYCLPFGTASGKTALKNEISIANQAYESGDLKSARERYETLYDAKPRNIEIAIGYIQTLLKLDAWGKALTVSETACQKHPRSSALWALAGKAQSRAGNLEQAQISYQKALKLNPLSYEAKVGIAELQMAFGRKHEVMDLLQSAIAIDPEQIEAYALLTQYYQSEGMLQAAVAMMKHVMKLTPRGMNEQLLHTVFPGMIELLESLGIATPFAVQSLTVKASGALHVFNTHIFIETYINDAGPFILFFDTGGSFVVTIDDRVSEQLGVTKVSSVSAIGVGGFAAASTAILKSISIGSLSATVIPAVIYDLHHTAQLLDTKVDGVFGTGLLQNLVIELDFSEQKIHFYSPPEARSPIPFDKKPESSANPKQIAMPFLLLGDAKICIPVWVNDKRVWAILDSGAGGEVFSKSFLRSLAPHEQFERFTMKTAGIGDEAPTTEVISVPTVSVEIGGKTFTIEKAIGMDFIDDGLSRYIGMEFAMIIGNPIIQQSKKMIIDYPNRILEFVYE